MMSFVEALDSFVDCDFLDGLTMDELRNKCFLDFVDSDQY